MSRFPEFILASRSPRRRALLARAGYRFRVVAPPLPEPPTPPHAAAPTHLAEALAYFKARSVAPDAGGQVVLGADTVVSAGGRIFGKAGDADEARRMLAAISAAPHAVTTGLAVIAPGWDAFLWVFAIDGLGRSAHGVSEMPFMMSLYPRGRRIVFERGLHASARGAALV